MKRKRFTTGLSANRKLLLAGAAGFVILAGAGGVFLAQGDPESAEIAGEAHAEGEAGHAEEGGGDGEVHMTPERLKAADIELVEVGKVRFGGEVIAQANVESSPTGMAILAARADGVITRIEAQLGDAVRAGETVALIQSREAASFAADKAAAAARAAAARAKYAREQRLFAANVTARQDLEAARAERDIAEAELQRATAAAAASGVTSGGRHIAVTSPIAGRVTAAPAVLGSYVTAGTELFRVADPQRIVVEAALPAQDAQRISIGDSAVVETASGVDVAARVRSITPAVDEESRSATAVLTLLGGSRALQPGEFVQARITPREQSGTGGLTVPEDAVQTVEGRDVVFVRTSEGFQAASVNVGRRSGGRAEILSGVQPGQTIAGSGAFLLKAELGKSEAEHGH